MITWQIHPSHSPPQDQLGIISWLFYIDQSYMVGWQWLLRLMSHEDWMPWELFAIYCAVQGFLLWHFDISFAMKLNNLSSTPYHPWYQGSWGQHCAHLGLTGPRWAPCWPHESCYIGFVQTSYHFGGFHPTKWQQFEPQMFNFSYIWCCGSLHHKIINNHCIDCERWTNPCLISGRT